MYRFYHTFKTNGKGKYRREGGDGTERRTVAVIKREKRKKAGTPGNDIR